MDHFLWHPVACKSTALGKEPHIRAAAKLSSHRLGRWNLGGVNLLSAEFAANSALSNVDG